MIHFDEVRILDVSQANHRPMAFFVIDFVEVDDADEGRLPDAPEDAADASGV